MNLAKKKLHCFINVIREASEVKPNTQRRQWRRCVLSSYLCYSLSKQIGHPNSWCPKISLSVSDTLYSASLYLIQLCISHCSRSLLFLLTFLPLFPSSYSRFVPTSMLHADRPLSQISDTHGVSEGSAILRYNVI